MINIRFSIVKNAPSFDAHMWKYFSKNNLTKLPARKSQRWKNILFHRDHRGLHKMQ